MMQVTRLFSKSEFASLVRNCEAKVLLLLQEKEVKKILGFFLVILILNFLFLLFNFSKLPPQLPLFYSLPWGEEQLGSKMSLFLLPLICFFIDLINFFLAVFLLERQPLAAKILIWAAVSINLLIFITLTRIIFLLT